ncbi:MAG: hypothetical protein JWN99_558 [Ilumatobacteraceae bacterium]|nr:hypothetical protein [Ilumatobacteraceae bacterium]
MTAPETELRRVWHGVAGAHHDDVIDNLLLRHREPQRHYHTATHIMWVCRHAAELALHHPVDDGDAVLAAALFHDAVYDPRSSTNEADSAALAVRTLTTVGWSDERCASVARMIMATAHQTSDHGSGDVQCDVLLDADLAILGSQVSAYQPYAMGVRAEYQHVDDAAWHIGRARVLQQFLDRPFIYRTTTMRQAREQRARANIAAEVASLRVDR